MFFPLSHPALSRKHGQNKWMLGRTGFVEAGERAQSMRCGPPKGRYWVGSSSRGDSIKNWMGKEECGRKDRSLVLFFCFVSVLPESFDYRICFIIILHLCQSFFLLKHFHRHYHIWASHYSCELMKHMSAPLFPFYIPENWRPKSN